MMRAATAVLGIVFSCAASAQESGSVTDGLSFALRVCGECHAVVRGAGDSRHPDAPPFSFMAQIPGLTALALTVSLQGAHRKMPDLVLTHQEMQDVTAYIMSLRRR